MAKRILNVVTNVGHYENPDHPTGLWLSELSLTPGTSSRRPASSKPSSARPAAAYRWSREP
jgi:hypothetical protein